MSGNTTPPGTPGLARFRGMGQFFLIVLTLHIPLFFYPIIRLCGWLELSIVPTTLLLIMLGGSQIFSRLLLRHRKTTWSRLLRLTADFWLGISPLLLICLLVFEALVGLSLVSPMNAAFAVIGTALACGVFGMVVAMLPIVRVIKFSSVNLHKPVRFVQITDVHIGSRSKSFLESIIYKINKLAPDFVCITGDFIDESGIPESDLRSLKSINVPIYFCIGNHEKYEDLDEILVRLTNLGVKVLRNDSEHYRPDLQVIGIDDMDDALQVQRQLQNIELDDQAFSLLLYHRPRGIEAAAKAGINLMLSGHTHNGQIVPFNFVVNRVFDKAKGLFQEGDTRLYVSQGTGTWGPIMRFGTQSEITLFEVSAET